jgi:hypothetical protein
MLDRSRAWLSRGAVALTVAGALVVAGCSAAPHQSAPRHAVPHQPVPRQPAADQPAPDQAVPHQAMTGQTRFLGYWSVHDGGLCVGDSLLFPAGGAAPPCVVAGSADDVGWIRADYGGVCDVIQVSGIPLCAQWVEFSFSPGGDGSIVGTVTNVILTGLNNAVINGPNPDPWLEPGDTFQLSYVAPGLLKTTYLHTHLPKSDIEGNPYWCGPGLSAANQRDCGA